MTRSDLTSLQDRLTERDVELLRDVEKYRLLTTKQFQRLTSTQPTPHPQQRHGPATAPWHG